MNFTTPKKENPYSGLVWILSALSLFAYGTLTLTNQNVPGVEKLVQYLSTVDGKYIYGAAFLSIFIEGLYLIGSFFPGSTLIIILSILSQSHGIETFLVTILIVFVGWCAAGGVNILFAKVYGVGILKKATDKEYKVEGRLSTTWFPSFRANYEVTQITEGGDPYKVFWSSVKVKFLVSLIMLGYTALLPFVIDINKMSDKDGATSVFLIGTISLVVGILKIRNIKLW